MGFSGGNMSRLSEAEVFVAVVEEGGFTAGARKLGVSKSTASKTVRALEERVGAPLLVRNTRHVSMTTAGKTFYERSAAALELLDQAEQAVAHEQEEVRGVLRISLPLSFGVRYVASAMASFQKAHPDLQVEASFTDRKIDLVDEGYDLAVRAGALRDSDLLSRRLATMRLYVVAAPEYLARRGTPETPEELKQHPCLRYSLLVDRHRWPLLGPDGQTTVVHVTGPLEADNGYAIVEAAAAGLGLALQPDWLAADALKQGRLVRVLPDWSSPPQGIWALYPPERRHSPKVTRFVEHLAKALDPPPWTERGV